MPGAHEHVLDPLFLLAVRVFAGLRLAETDEFAQSFRVFTTSRALSDIGWQGQSSAMPISNAQPAWKPRSPSPVVSMKTGARHATRPDLDSVTMVLSRLPSRNAAATRV